jgi:hypothetical protein
MSAALKMGGTVSVPMVSDQVRLRELRDRLSQCIGLAKASSASVSDSRPLQQVLALLWAALESLDHHYGVGGSGSNQEAP